LPVGSGNAFVSLYNIVKKRNLKIKLVGVTSRNTHNSFADKLANSFSGYEQEYKQILKDGHEIMKVSEDEIKSAYHDFKNLFVCEPSSTVVWAVLKKLKLNEKENIVVINSGRGIA